MTESFANGAAAAPLSIRTAASLTSAAVTAGRQFPTDVKRGRRIDAILLRRAIEGGWVANVLALDAPSLAPNAALAALMDGRTNLDLAEGLQFRRVRVMDASRIELSEFNDTTRDRRRANGLFGEIISWKLRMFVPTDASGVDILSNVLGSYPVARIGEREAA